MTVSRAREIYETWLADPLIDEQTKMELRNIADDEREIYDRFYKELAFGTGGLRGIIGAGTNRINRYTVGKSTQGLAAYVLEEVKREQPRAALPSPAVAIAYDSRHQSPEFALQAALVLAGNGIRTYLFESLRPTPELSYAVRALGAHAGIVITASHNPPEYNGYKVYGADGGQLVSEAANRVIDHIGRIKSLEDVRQISEADALSTSLLQYIGADIDDMYIDAVSEVSLNKPPNPAFNAELSIVYTPLHGSGNMLVRQALKRIGCTRVRVVPQQESPDPNFSTVASPNPEERAAFTLALQLAEQIDAELILGTDPDCDRMGAVVKRATGEYEVLSGNQIGALLTHYILGRLHADQRLPQHGVLIKTIVTSELGAVIAESYGIPTLNTLTGFKYIGELMTQFESTQEYEFLFGYEESYGYLAGTHARDKDAVVASMLLCEAAAYYKKQGQSLYEVLQQLYETHGYYAEQLESRTMKGAEGVAQIRHLMEQFRSHPPEQIAGIDIREMKDYMNGIDGLPIENVLKYILDDGSWFCLRPSGTEPKIKIYFSVVTPSAEQSAARLHQLVTAVMSRIDE